MNAQFNSENNEYSILRLITSGSVHVDPIKLNKGVGTINRSKLTYLYGFIFYQVTRITGGSIAEYIVFHF